MAEKVKKPATKPAVPKKAAKQSKSQPTGVAELRKELGAARRDHRMKQLESPAKLRALRKTLARELTKERVATLKEANG